MVYLEERESEFARHLLVTRLLESRIDATLSDADVTVEVRHINTLKSGLIIHLYNIVEAIMKRTLSTVGSSVVTERPNRWTEQVLKEWVRAAIWGGEERIGEGSLSRLIRVSSILVSGAPPDAFVVKGEPGSWNEKAIEKVAERLGCVLALSDEVKRAAYERVYRDDTTALTYLSRRRNAIAHGETTFEEGAHDLTLHELSNLAGRVLPYLREIAESFDVFVNSKSYLTAGEMIA